MKKPNTTTAKNARPQPQETPATTETATTPTAVASEGSPVGTDTGAKPEVVIVEPAKGTDAPEPEPRKAKGAKEGVAQIVTRFPAELAARLDRYTDGLRNGAAFGLRVSRADAVRILVHERLAQLEAGAESPSKLTHSGK